MQVFIPVSHCKDTHNFDKTNNFFKKSERKERRTNPLSYLETLKMLIYILLLPHIQNLPSYPTNYVSYNTPSA